MVAYELTQEQIDFMLDFIDMLHLASEDITKKPMPVS